MVVSIVAPSIAAAPIGGVENAMIRVAVFDELRRCVVTAGKHECK